MLRETHKIADFPHADSQSMLNALQSFVDGLRLRGDAESFEAAQLLCKDISSLKITDPGGSPTIGPPSTVPEFVGSSGSSDTGTIETTQLAQALSAKIQRHLVGSCSLVYICFITHHSLQCF